MLSSEDWTALFDMIGWIAAWRQARNQEARPGDLEARECMLDFAIRRCAGDEWDLEWRGTSGHLHEADIYMLFADKTMEYLALRYSRSPSSPVRILEHKELLRLRKELQKADQLLWVGPNPPLCSNHPWGYCPPLILNEIGRRVEGCSRPCPCPEHALDCDKGDFRKDRNDERYWDYSGACPIWLDFRAHQLRRPSRYDPARPELIG